MAISKGFFDKWTYGVTELINFLNENKTGTFLENINLKGDITEGNLNPKLIFQQTLEGTGNRDQASLLTSWGSSDTKSTVKYQIERDGEWRDFATNDNSQSSFNRSIYDCLLCSNGLIVRQRIYDTTSTYRIVTPFILTVDNNGRLVVFCVNTKSGCV